MIKDPIVEEVRAAREKLFDACNRDLDTLLQYLKEREQQHRSRMVSPEIVKARRSSAGARSTQPGSAAGAEPAHAPEP